MKPQTDHLLEITEKVIRAPLQKAIDAPWVLCDSRLKQKLVFKSRSIYMVHRGVSTSISCSTTTVQLAKQ